MKKIRFLILLLAIPGLSFIGIAQEVEEHSCSSFMLKSDSILIAGHNLDKGKHAHGVVVVNKRGVQKQCKSWTELAYNKSVPNPPMEWTSKYGSVTFNRFCRDFPDGGMNEAGLFIAEMSLAGTTWPVDDSKPKIFMCLWMQYVLDSFESIEQVVQSAHDLTIEGWSWHFFAADCNGNAAVIEFLDEKVVVYKGDDLPIPTLANVPYAKELELIKKYEGFGGTKIIDLENDQMPVFNYGAKMIKEFDPLKSPAIDYGFDMLKKFSWSGTQWSYVCDLKNLKVYFKTQPSPEIKTLDFTSLDFSCETPAKMLDIHAFLSGPVEQYLFDYSTEYNMGSIKTTFLVSNYEEVFVKFGSTLEQAVSNFGRYSDSTKCILIN
ncbi:MAG: linear amide C-N hydrolase [Bacteroidales bacterium]|nr:linear amide C-N hydrolase [Bacteroidales bacterium]